MINKEDLGGYMLLAEWISEGNLDLTYTTLACYYTPPLSVCDPNTADTVTRYMERPLESAHVL